MGEMSKIMSKRHSAWSGMDISDPVELFISSIENDSSNESDRLHSAWESISSDENTPAGRWKSTEAGDFQSWNDLKTNLLDVFGRLDSYTVQDKLEFVLSLQKRDSELFSSLFHRVGWVIHNVLASNSIDEWKTIHFLLGLSELARDSILKQLKIVDNLTAIVEGMDNCKQEDYDVTEEGIDDSKFDVEKGYEPTVDNKDPFEEDIKDDDDSKTDLKDEVDSEKTLEMQYFGCKKCAKLFTKGEELERHMRQHDRRAITHTKAPKSQQKIECHACGETFDHRGRFEAHMADSHPGEKPYKCQLCSMTFTQKNNLVNHTMIHTGEKPHQCDQCPKRFRRVQHLLEHKQTHAPGFVKPFQCEICQTRFLQKSAMKYHMLKHEVAPEEKPHQCELCPRKFKDKYTLVRHLRLHDGTFECKICLKKFETGKELKKHTETHNSEVPHFTMSEGDDKPYMCNKCSEKFSDKASLEQHLSRGHMGDEGGRRNGTWGKTVSKCHVCDEIFASRKNMEDHVFDRHPETKPHKCQECSMVFTQNINLIEHTKTHTGEKPFQCEICANRFARKSQLQSHMGIHIGHVKNYSCELCGKKFTQKPNLNRHIMMHKGEKPYQCEICSHRFIDKSALRLHMNTHSDEKPFECDVCMGKFKTKVILKLHKKTHKNELPFQCQVCSKMFKLQSYLNTHMRIHTDEKSYECEVCHKKFNQAGGKRQHMVTVHEGKRPYQCQVCSKKFGGSGDLKRHMKTHTREFFSKSESELDETMVNDT